MNRYDGYEFRSYNRDPVHPHYPGGGFLHLNVSESISVKVLEDHAGVLWIAYLSGKGLASYERHQRRLTLVSFKDREPPVASVLSGAEGIPAEADGNPPTPATRMFGDGMSHLSVAHGRQQETALALTTHRGNSGPTRSGISSLP